MERLTIEYDGHYVPKELCTIDRLGGADDCEPCHEDCDKDCSKCVMQKCFDRLAEYEDLEEQGLLLKSPCKIGDKFHTIILGRIEVYEVSGFLTDRHGVMLRLETRGIAQSRFIESEQIGKTVFLTEQEAQSALEKMKNETVL